MTSTASRSDWILLLLAKDTLGVDGPDALDPIRIQKGMFLLSEIGPERGAYSFRPYNWGPFSSDIYRDLEDLVRTGLARKIDMPGRSWAKYQVTDDGRAAAQAIAARLGAPATNWLGQLRKYLTERTFAQLLREVYERFPEMATRSQFQR